jgi:hypothetical protein
MIVNSRILFMINVEYENDKCLQLVSFWRAVRRNNFKVAHNTLANKSS